jgi:hypothetical protein
MSTVRIRPSVETSSGRRKGWIKHVTACDSSKTNGYAFDGDFLDADREVELPIGAILVRVDPEGSVKNNWQSGHVLRLEADSSLSELTEGNPDWRNDFLSIRDIVCEALNTPPPNPLAEFSDEALLAEVRGRGLSL